MPAKTGLKSILTSKDFNRLLRVVSFLIRSKRNFQREANTVSTKYSKKADERVLVLNAKGKPLAIYHSVSDVAYVYQSTEDTIRRYIKSGDYWKKKKVFLDLAI